MKFTALVTLLPLLLSSTVGYATASRDVFQARQAHAKKSLVDVCAAVDTDIHIDVGDIHILAGHIKLCLCLSILPGFLDSHPVAKKVIDKYGRDDARNYFAGIIKDQKGRQECHYPTHAVPFCSIDNPCRFSCEKGHTPFPGTKPTACVCQPPFTECNGVCGNFPRGCGSQGFSSKKRHDNTCPVGKTVCGVPNNGKGHECVDITKDPESCGGCTVASPFGNNVADGKNCHALPNVDKVQCEKGACKVISCKNGFTVSQSKDSCVKPHLNRLRRVRRGDIIDDVLNLVVGKHLLAHGFDVVSVGEWLHVHVEVLDHDHILEALLSKGAIAGIHDLAELKKALGLHSRRDIDNTDALLDLIIKKDLFAKAFDIVAAKAKLHAVIRVFNVDHVLEVLLLEHAFAQPWTLVQLKGFLGLAVHV